MEGFKAEDIIYRELVGCIEECDKKNISFLYGEVNMKKILAVTGIRSEIEYLTPVLEQLRKDGFDISIAVSGAHLSDWHDNSLKEIEEKGFKIADKIDSLFFTNRKIQRVKGIGSLTYGLAQTVEREKPDFLLVVGDREESIATALVGNYMDILTVHIGGGDTVYGNSDDPIRHAVSSLAHIHLTLNESYKDILIKMGEEDFRVFNVGSPSLDRIEVEEKVSVEEISSNLNLEMTERKYIVLIKHPLSSESDKAYEQMKNTLIAIEDFCKTNNIKCIGIYPNTDPGAFDMIAAIQEISSSKHIHFYKNLERKLFINVIRNALCLIGNSSMGILEAPFFQLPVVNVGNRQKGRVNAGNVIFTSYLKEGILDALNQSCYNQGYRERIKENKFFYGDGRTCAKISKILNDVDLQDSKWHIKKLNYI